MKALEEETVNVIPLIKNGEPIVSGLTLKSPAEMFNSILGTVSNAATDTINGVTSIHEEYQKYKQHSWAAYEELHGNRTGAFDWLARKGFAISLFSDFDYTGPN